MQSSNKIFRFFLAYICILSMQNVTEFQQIFYLRSSKKTIDLTTPSPNFDASAEEKEKYKIKHSRKADCHSQNFSI